MPISPEPRYDVLTRMKIFFFRVMTALFLAAESLRGALWRVFFWSAFLAGLFMLDAPGLFQQSGIYIFWSAYAAGVIYFLALDLRKFRWPRLVDIDRRLERESGIFHRPLSEKKDSPAFAQESPLWRRERLRREGLIARLKIPQWRSKLASADPYALRLMALLVAFGGYAVAGPEWNERLRAGFMPFDLGAQISTAPAIIVTITPPDYTGAEQIVLQGSGHLPDIQNIPAQSVLKIHVNSAFGRPVAHIGDITKKLDDLGDGLYGLEMTIANSSTTAPEKPQRFALSQFFITRVSFEFNVLPDAPPVISLQLAEKDQDQEENLPEEEAESEAEAENHADSVRPEDDIFKQDAPGEEQTPEDVQETPPAPPEPEYKEPQIIADGQIQIPLSVFDDYGVKAIRTRMILDPVVEDAPIGYPEEQNRSIMSPPGKDFKLEPLYDFTDNPWAGLPVHIDIEAEDLIGQKTALKTIEITLPERDFQHPIAKKLVALRKQLAWTPGGAFEPLVKELEGLLAYPADFQGDGIVFLAIRIAASRLFYAQPQSGDTRLASVRSVMALLWDTALRIEDGNLSLAARNLRQAQMALEDSISNPDLSDEKIAELMNELKSAMEAYLLELQKELQKKLAEGQDLPLLSPERLAEAIDPQALEDFMRQMQSEMMKGETGKAQNMLSQLQRLLDLLNPNMAQPLPEDMQAMQDGVNELQELIDRQQQLLDQTKQQIEDTDNDVRQNFGSFIEPDTGLIEQWGLSDLPPPPSTQDHKSGEAQAGSTAMNKAEQEALRFILGQLMMDTSEALGKIPEAMGLAEQEMRSSSQFLGENNPDLSTPHQTKAIEYLKQAQEELNKMFEERMQEMAAMGMALNGDRQPGGGSKQDPLGRPYGGGNRNGPPSPNSTVKIPDEAQRKRVEEILRILRQRSGELERPREELEYFERLLRQF